MEAFSAVIEGRVANAYALVRPPGHHAIADVGMGFCLFGNAALSILHAQAMHKVGRVAIVDWDVHHGNGTQAAFYQRNDVLTISLHQDNLYPANSGGLEERRAGVSATISTFPLPPGSGNGAYVAAFEQVVVPALMRWPDDRGRLRLRWIGRRSARPDDDHVGRLPRHDPDADECGARSARRPPRR
jgi:acetoin utilization deacetylase AcuC-like enzyme